MITPLEKKRASYLTFYFDGIFDVICNEKENPIKNSSAYYKRGFEDGVKIKQHIEKYGISNIGADNGKKIRS